MGYEAEVEPEDIPDTPPADITLEPPTLREAPEEPSDLEANLNPADYTYTTYYEEPDKK